MRRGAGASNNRSLEDLLAFWQFTTVDARMKVMHLYPVLDP